MVIKPLTREEMVIAFHYYEANKDIFVPEKRERARLLYFASSRFYGVHLGNNALPVAYFCILPYAECNVLGCVYVEEQYRKQGIFNAIVNFALTKSIGKRLEINAEKTNTLACEIYERKFYFIGEDKETKYFAIKY